MRYFRESLRGFNKTDVTQFIDNMDKDHRKEIDGLNEQIQQKDALLDKYASSTESLMNTIKTMEEKLADFCDKADYEKLRADYEQILAVNAELEEQVAILKKDYSNTDLIPDEKPGDDHWRNIINGLTKQLEDSEIQRLQLESRQMSGGDDASDNIELLNAKDEAYIAKIKADELATALENKENELDALRSELEAYKEERNKPQDPGQVYENVTSNLGKIIYVAETTAESIVADAKAESEKILEKARSKSEAANRHLSERVQELHNISRSLIEDFRSIMMEQKQKGNKFFEQAEKFIMDWESGQDGIFRIEGL